VGERKLKGGNQGRDIFSGTGMSVLGNYADNGGKAYKKKVGQTE